MYVSVLQRESCNHTAHFDVNLTRKILKGIVKPSIDQLLDQGPCQVFKPIN